MKPTETVEGWEKEFTRLYNLSLYSNTENELKAFIRKLIDLALTKERTRVNEVLEGMRETITGKSGQEYEKWQKYRNETLSDAQKRITEKEV